MSITAFSITLLSVSHLRSNTLPIHKLSLLIHLPGFASSSSFLEHRVGFYSDDSNQLYPQMKTFQQMDYVYAP